MKAAGAGGTKGFLAKVVDRAHGDASAAAPRLPGLFEPVFATRPATDAIRSDAFAPDALDSDSRIAPPQRGDARATLRTDTSRDAGDTRSRARPRTRRSDGDEMAPAPERKSLAAVPTSSPQAKGAQLAPVATPTAIELRPRATLVAAAQKAPAAPASDTPRRDRSRNEADDTTQRTPAPAPTRTPPQQQALALERSVLMPKFVPIEAPRSNIRAEADHQPIDATPTKPEPAIHVSIGRIEVRAPSQPAATAPRAQRTQRPMSLDEYLGRKERAR